MKTATEKAKEKMKIEEFKKELASRYDYIEKLDMLKFYSNEWNIYFKPSEAIKVWQDLYEM